MMSPGPVEESGKVASALVDSLKTSPITLALVVFNLVFVIVVYLGARDVRTSFDKTTTTLLAQQEKMEQMLFNCTPIEHQR
jgi:hypothetical protein